MGNIHTLPRFPASGLYKDSELNLSLGIGDQQSFPEAQRSHNFSGLEMEPANRQLMPTIAMGIEVDGLENWASLLTPTWPCSAPDELIVMMRV